MASDSGSTSSWFLFSVSTRLNWDRRVVRLLAASWRRVCEGHARKGGVTRALAAAVAFPLLVRHCQYQTAVLKPADVC
jgi:hypothetical protein